MKHKVTCNETDRKDYYILKIETYKDSFESTFEKSELRSIIGTLDSAI